MSIPFLGGGGGGGLDMTGAMGAGVNGAPAMGGGGGGMPGMGLLGQAGGLMGQVGQSTNSYGGSIGGGAAQGAATGAMAGSVVPGIGTAIGAVAGALMGAMSGALQHAQQQRAMGQQMMRQAQTAAPKPGTAITSPATPQSASPSAVNIGGDTTGQQYTPEQLAAIRGDQMLTQAVGGGGAQQDQSLGDLGLTPGVEQQNAIDYTSMSGTSPTMQGLSVADLIAQQSNPNADTANAPAPQTEQSWIQQLGLDKPQATISALGGGLQAYQQNRQINANIRAGNRAFAVAPGIHAGAPGAPVKVGQPIQRRSPLEEFALLMRGL